MYKQLTRLGTQKDKFIVTIHVHDVVFSNESYKDFEEGSLNLCFARDLKFVSSKSKSMTFHEETQIYSLTVEEQLPLLVTLYKDTKTNEYQEKFGQLILREWNQEKTKFDGREAFKLRLHKIIPEVLESSKDYIWPIDGFGEVVASVTVSVQVVNQADGDILAMKAVKGKIASGTPTVKEIRESQKHQLPSMTVVDTNNNNNPDNVGITDEDIKIPTTAVSTANMGMSQESNTSTYSASGRAREKEELTKQKVGALF